MPFLMIRNDITKVAADAIVNPANRNLLQGSGTSRAIYQAAGEQELTAACEAIGLLKSAGYAFSDGSKRDWIVRYCLEHKIYNINQVNTLLFEYDQEQLGA